MAVPKKRHSNSRQGKRRASNYQLTARKFSHCPACGAPSLSHHACPACGLYKGRSAIKLKTKKKTKEKK